MKVLTMQTVDGRLRSRANVDDRSKKLLRMRPDVDMAGSELLGRWRPLGGCPAASSSRANEADRTPRWLGQPGRALASG